MAKFPTYEEMVKNVAEKALDEVLYDDRSIREWMKIIASEDAISRQAVLEYIEGSEAELGHSTENELVCQDIKALPPVTPQTKTGHWIIIDDCESFIAKCSVCGRIEDSRMVNKYPYCHCGAKMKSEEE